MDNEVMDCVAKDRMLWVTLFADALVYIIDIDGAKEDNTVVIEKALNGTLCEYIFERYGDKPIFCNTLDISLKRYLNPLYRIGFEEATSRRKNTHAVNNGLLNIVGVTFDIIANWYSYIDDVQNELKLGGNNYGE